MARASPEEQQQLVSGEADADWGDVSAVVHGPPENVAADETWCSVIGFWLTCLIWVFEGIVGALCKCAYYFQSMGMLQSAKWDRPWWLSFNMWRYTIALGGALARQKKSRLDLFLWEKSVFGGGPYFLQGEGVWTTNYDDCLSILKAPQRRGKAFGCWRAVTPELFASDLLIFLSNESTDSESGSSEWAAYRAILHQTFLDRNGPTYPGRISKMKENLSEGWSSPKLADLDGKRFLRVRVCQCIFFVMFGKWLKEEEAAILLKWRSLAPFFVLPRFPQRLMCNYGIRQVQKLREETVGLIEQYNLQGVFQKMNASLPEQYRREPVVKLCDEIMYAVGFAGIGGTCACVESVSRFLQLRTGEVPQETVDFRNYATSEDMIRAYKRNKVAFIKETCRLDPPVTSATTVLKEDEKIDLGGKSIDVHEGMLRQYTIGLANRDEEVFKDPGPEVFDPTRVNLNSAVSWNGCFGENEESEQQTFPRICPGRYLSLDICTAIIDHALSDS